MAGVGRLLRLRRRFGAARHVPAAGQADAAQAEHGGGVAVQVLVAGQRHQVHAQAAQGVHGGHQGHLVGALGLCQVHHHGRVAQPLGGVFKPLADLSVQGVGVQVLEQQDRHHQHAALELQNRLFLECHCHYGGSL